MADGTICLVTIHGIGFQIAPGHDAMGRPTGGYADQLHGWLQDAFDDPSMLDPTGPIYVQSNWPPDSNITEAGLERLGTWQAGAQHVIDTTHAPLTDGKYRIAHVALVYSHLEDQFLHPGAALQAGASALLALHHYASVAGMLHMALADTAAILRHHGAPQQEVTPSLRVRQDIPHQRHLLDLHPHQPATQDASSGLHSTLVALESDVCAYVTRNDLRERVRAFVRDAVHRICYRDDVAGVVLNTHSNGTVIGMDTLKGLTPAAADKVRYLVTAGSPLRKYVDLFYWGMDTGSMCSMPAPGGWMNFWDPVDPVGDPLGPSQGWRRGDPLPPSEQNESLFEQTDPVTGKSPVFPIVDRQVDNMTNSLGSGLQAHNYWDNRKEFVAPLADLLRQVVGS